MKNLIYVLLVFFISSCESNHDYFLVNDQFENEIQIEDDFSAKKDWPGIKCPRQDVGYFELERELKKIANCGKSPQLCTQEQVFIEETCYNFFSPIQSYCGSGGCSTCAPPLPETFTPEMQDALIQQAHELISSCNNPCGSNAEITFNFSTPYVSCSCGDINPDGSIHESNTSIYVDITFSCCQHEIAGDLGG